MNSLRTFILFVLIMCVVLLLQTANIARRNSLITNSDSFVKKYEDKKVSKIKHFIYTGSRVVSENTKSISMTSVDDRSTILKWYQDNFFKVNDLQKNNLIISNWIFRDQNGTLFSVNFIKNNSFNKINIKM